MNELALEMKRGWDERATEDARWYINTVRRAQSEEEFDATGHHEVQCQIVDALPLLTGGRAPQELRLLEIGCGIGRMTKHLAALFGEVYAVDVSAQMIQQAQQRLRQLPNVRLFETNGQDFALFPAQSFDVVFSAYVFQHIPSAAIIRSNIVDGWRVLKPGGVFKFVTNGITDPAYLNSRKDSWNGDVFPEADLRALVREQQAQLLGLYGEETQYCWTLLRRRLTTAPPASRQENLQIVLAGHVDNLRQTEIEVNSERAYVTLVVRGSFSEWDDAASVVAEIGGQAILPRYVGPLGANVRDLLPAQTNAADQLLQVNLRLNPALPRGATPLRLRFHDGATAVTDALSLK